MAAYFSRATKPSSCRSLVSFSTRPSSNRPSSCPPYPSFGSLKSIIRSESDPMKLAQLCKSYVLVPSLRRYWPLTSMCVRKLARAHRLDLVDIIVNQRIDESSETHLSSEALWVRIIVVYSQVGRVDKALRVFDRMLQQKSCRPTEKSFCAILSALVDGKFDDTKFLQTFQTVLSKVTASTGVESYNSLVKAFCKAGQLDSARKLLGKMEHIAEVKPNIDSYNLLLGAYMKSQKIKEFDGVVKEILERGLKPNLSTFNHMILRLCKAKECLGANKLLDEMMAKGVKPNSRSYAYIISGFCEVNDLDAARKVLGKMVGDGLSPPSFCYKNLLRHMVEEGESEAALDVCKQIVNRNGVPLFKTAEVSVSKDEEAREVMEDVKKRLRGDALGEKLEASLRS